MTDAASTDSGSGWGAVFGQLIDAAGQAYAAKQQNQRRPPPPRRGEGGFLDFGYGNDPTAPGGQLTDQQKVSAIFRSPVTWIALAALVVGAVYLIRR